MSAHLITTPVVTTIHARCDAPVLTGHAEGIRARVDLTPLSRNGEVAAIIAGLQTYTLTRDGLVHRDAIRVRDRHLRGPVLAEHRCHHQVPADHRATTAPAATRPATEGIPY